MTFRLFRSVFTAGIPVSQLSMSKQSKYDDFKEVCDGEGDAVSVHVVPRMTGRVGQHIERKSHLVSQS